MLHHVYILNCVFQVFVEDNNRRHPDEEDI